MYNLQKGLLNSKRKNINTVIEWIAQHERNVETAVEHLTSAVLTIPVKGDNFIIETDASVHIIAGVLSIIRDSKFNLRTKRSRKKYK